MGLDQIKRDPRTHDLSNREPSNRMDPDKASIRRRENVNECTPGGRLGVNSDPCRASDSTEKTRSPRIHHTTAALPRHGAGRLVHVNAPSIPYKTSRYRQFAMPRVTWNTARRRTHAAAHALPRRSPGELVQEAAVTALPAGHPFSAAFPLTVRRLSASPSCLISACCFERW